MQYLQDSDMSCYNVDLKVKIKTPKMDDFHQLSISNTKYLYFSVAQTIAHHTVTGCNFNTGDLLGSGTISGPEKHERGSIMELCWGGKEPISLPNDETRTFLNDGDTILLEGIAHGNGFNIGFGNCSGEVLPALDESHFF
jgi:fumarylacetoacetase